MKMTVFNVMYRLKTASKAKDNSDIINVTEPVQIKVASSDQNGVAAAVAKAIKIPLGASIQIDSATTVASEVHFADSSSAAPVPVTPPAPPQGPTKLGH